MYNEDFSVKFLNIEQVSTCLHDKAILLQTLLSVLAIDKRINPEAINGPSEKYRIAFPWLFSIELAGMDTSLVQLSTT